MQWGSWQASGRTASVPTVYLYDGKTLLEEVDQTGNVLARYTQSKKIDEALAELRSGTASYYEADGLGSSTSLTNSAGTVAGTYTYDSFGLLTASSGTLINPFQYTGREADNETGLYYYRARYYNPPIGRFLSEDPIEFKGGTNFYAYVGNNPLNKRDPRGLSPDGECRVVCIRLATLIPLYYCSDHGAVDINCDCPDARGFFLIPDPAICNEKQIMCKAYMYCTPQCAWFWPKGLT
jgi:RHS repeat-associated protein